MKMKGLVASAVAATALLLVCSTAALAGIVVQIHISTERYSESGGTTVTCALGCEDFTVGDTTLPNKWEVIERAWHDTDAMLGINPVPGETTVISYTVGNDGFLSPITSFHVPTNGSVPAFLSAPSGWMVTFMGGTIWWETIIPHDATVGIVGGTTLGGFVVVYTDHLPIVFTGPTTVDLADSTEITSDDWVVSTVPITGPGGPGGEGCTPGFWKQKQHFDSWPAPYTPNTLFSDVFEDAFPGKTLVQVMLPGGGNNQLRQLGRHTVAALLNAASSGVDYDLTADAVIDLFNGVFPGTNREYRELKDIFANFNEQGCPID